ncbi:MAG: ribonuclease HI family protein [bacterium]
MKKLKVYTDGASRGNPGIAGIGVLITDEAERVVQTHKKFIGVHTNNFAEYIALIESVKQLKSSEIGFEEINFFCDSELIVKQIKGEYKIKNKDLIRLSLEFWKEIKSMNKKFSITHIPREQNRAADKLANEALDESSNTNTDRSLLIG